MLHQLPDGRVIHLSLEDMRRSEGMALPNEDRVWVVLERAAKVVAEQLGENEGDIAIAVAALLLARPLYPLGTRHPDFGSSR